MRLISSTDRPTIVKQTQIEFTTNLRSGASVGSPMNNFQYGKHVSSSESTDANRFSELVKRAARIERERNRVAEVLAELCSLLQEYAPAWYTKREHARAQSALRAVRKC